MTAVDLLEAPGLLEATMMGLVLQVFFPSPGPSLGKVSNFTAMWSSVSLQEKNRVYSGQKPMHES